MPENRAIGALRALHKIDTQIDKVHSQKDLLPLSLRRIKQRLGQQREALETKRQDLTKLRSESRAKEVLLRAAEEEIQGLTVKLNTATTNKEYTALQNEITSKRVNASRIEDQALAAMADIEALEAEMREARRAIEEIQREHDDEAAKVEVSAAQLDHKAAQLQAKRQQATQAVDDELLQEYLRIAAKKGSSALAPVVGGTCQGCFMKLPPQLGHTLAAGRSIVHCPSCSRILYLP